MPRTDYLDDTNAPVANSVKPAVSAVVQDASSRILMIARSDNGLYAIPGGGLEPGESLTAAVKREVLEETGIDVVVNGLVGVYSNPQHVIAFDDGEVRQEFSVCFTAEPVGGELRTSSESTEVVWVPLAELDQLEVHPSIRQRIDHAIVHRAKPYFT